MRVVWIILIALLHGDPEATTRESPSPATQPARAIVDYPLPPASDFSKLIAPIAKRYGLPIPGKSFAELRTIRLSPDGHTRSMAVGDAPISSPSAEVARYSLYVPGSYGAGDKSFGLMIWIAPEVGVELLEGWRKVLDDHELLFIAPHDVPNESHSVFRIFMAIESARQMKARYNIDPDRIYVAGMSGGGRISSHAGVFFPELFSGAFCIVGCNFYRNIPAGAGRIYPGFWPNPIAADLQRGRTNSRLVLMTGSRDFNQPSTKAAYEAYQQDQWAHVTYIEVPEMAHQRPNSEWFEKGVVALDEPLAAGARDQYDQGQAFEKQHKLGEACLAFESSARHAKGQSFAADAAARAAAIRNKFEVRRLAIIQLIDQKKLDQAGGSVRQLKSDFGPLAAPVAQQFFDQIRDLRKTRLCLKTRSYVNIDRSSLA